MDIFFYRVEAAGSEFLPLLEAKWSQSRAPEFPHDEHNTFHFTSTTSSTAASNSQNPYVQPPHSDATTGSRCDNCSGASGWTSSTPSHVQHTADKTIQAAAVTRRYNIYERAPPVETFTATKLPIQRTKPHRQLQPMVK